MGNYRIKLLERKKHKTFRNPRYNKNRRHSAAYNRWRHSDSDHHTRWIESLRPENLNIFVGIHGPKNIPKIKEYVHFQVQPFLEVASRTDPSIPPAIYALGEETLDIIGIIDFKQIADKKRNLYKIVVFVVQNSTASIRLVVPDKYKDQLASSTRNVFCPLAGAKFYMLYNAKPPTPTVCQGVIHKIYYQEDLIEQYIPQCFQDPNETP